MRRQLPRPTTPPSVELRARQLRSWLTPSEQLLWAAIRANRLGVQFRRQVVIGRFIVDFLAPALRLVVEVDGGYHARREHADARRDAKLRRRGYRVVRVDAELVGKDLAAVLALLSAEIAALQ
jgi:very-short-patch-repair endonuclease